MPIIHGIVVGCLVYLVSQVWWVAVPVGLWAVWLSMGHYDEASMRR